MVFFHIGLHKSIFRPGLEFSGLRQDNLEQVNVPGSVQENLRVAKHPVDGVANALPGSQRVIPDGVLLLFIPKRSSGDRFDRLYGNLTLLTI